MIDVEYHALVPPLSAADYQALKLDIKAVGGVLVPVEYDENGAILDGFHRVKACGELGITTWPRIERLGLSDVEKRAHARRLNLARRHLSTAQKRALIEQQLKETPQQSDRQIAASLGVDDKTVGTARVRLEATAEIPQLTRTTGADGKDRPRQRAYKFSDPSPEGEAAILDAAAAIVSAEEKKTASATKKSKRKGAGAKPPKPTEKQKIDHERLWRVLRAIENIAEQDISPQEWLDNLPPFMNDHLSGYMQLAEPWLQTFLQLWRNRNAN